MVLKIPKSDKPHGGFVMSNGLNDAIETACSNMGMSKSEFFRYCIMKTLQDLSVLSSQIHSMENSDEK